MEGDGSVSRWVEGDGIVSAGGWKVMEWCQQVGGR